MLSIFLTWLALSTAPGDTQRALDASGTLVGAHRDATNGGWRENICQEP